MNLGGKMNDFCLEFRTSIKTISHYDLDSVFWLILQVMKHLSWSSGMNTASEKCFYLGWIHFYLTELKQKACILDLWSVKMKLWVFKSSVKMCLAKIKSLGIERSPVGFVRCGGGNTGVQFVFTSSLWRTQEFYKGHERHFLFIFGHLYGVFATWSTMQALFFPEVWKIKIFWYFSLWKWNFSNKIYFKKC